MSRSRNNASSASSLPSERSELSVKKSSGSISPNSSNRSDLSDRSYTMRELACNLRDAVVLVSGHGLVTESTGKTTITTRTGNGFFIKGHYIICPADLILMHPDTFSSGQRIPSHPSISTSGLGGATNPNALIRVSRILVDVSNVNGCSSAYSYEADIIGIDGAANIAVLCINMDHAWNHGNPPLRVCHPVLQWGKSRSSCPGDRVMVIGNTSAVATIGLTRSKDEMLAAENAIAIGNIADNRYIFPGGQVPGELLLLSHIMTHGTQRGLPVITIDGTVIGMIVHIANGEYNVAISEFFMRRPVKALIRSRQDNAVPDHYRGFVELVDDPIGQYYRFNKSWLGLSGIMMTPADYHTDLVMHSDNTITRVPAPDPLSTGPSSKEIMGYRILMTNSPNPLFPSLKSSPSILEVISHGDIITHINGCLLGDRKKQIAPSLVMWRVRPGDTITLMYKKQAERFETTHEIMVPTDSYDPFLDFPFYAYSSASIQSMLPTLI